MIKNILVCILVLSLINIFSGCLDEDKDDNDQDQNINNIIIGCSVDILGNNILLKHKGGDTIRFDSIKAIINIGNDTFNISSKGFELLFHNEDEYWSIGELFAIHNDNLSIPDVFINLYVVDKKSDSVIIHASNKYDEFKVIDQ
jgi:hypothetical protein